MIVKMLKAFVVARAADRDRLLGGLRELGVLHVHPVDPDKAVAEPETLGAIDCLRRAAQLLANYAPAGAGPQLAPLEAAAEALDIERQSAERKARLGTLHRQIDQLAVWGDVRLEQFAQLRQAGLEVRFYAAPRTDIVEFAGDCVQVICDLPGKKALVVMVDRGQGAAVPASAEPVEFPLRDRPALRAEAAEIDRALGQSAERLGELAHLTGAMETERLRLRRQAEYTVADRSALADEDLFAVQGWMPADEMGSLASRLKDAGVRAAVQGAEPAEDERPPTLIRYPRWARPIKGLFDMLGTVPGYNEYDVSWAFMLALPFFAAMLISDAGYGAVMFLGPLLLYPKASKVLGVQFTRLVITMGAVATVWGLLTGAAFGFPLFARPIIPVDMSDQSRSMLMSLSFYIGAVHLSVAQLWRAVAIFPDQRFLNRMGWAAFIWGMLGVVRMFVLDEPMGWSQPWYYLLISGGALAVLFESKSWNPVKRVLLGVANFPLSMLSAFSDVISYVRLMAVGLASSVLATSFNEMALEAGSWPLAIVIMVFGHGLNLSLALIALFAHGVRLNMLEFSTNLGMQWTGVAYRPFARAVVQENQI